MPPTAANLRIGTASGVRGSTTCGDLAEARVLGTPEELAALQAALDRMEPPDPNHTPGGPRSLAQRRYDALISLAGLGLADSRGRIDPTHTVNIVIDAATLAGQFNPDGRCEILGGGSVLPATVQRLLCDSWISRVVMDTDGEILDLGRSAPTVQCRAAPSHHDP